MKAYCACNKCHATGKPIFYIGYTERGKSGYSEEHLPVYACGDKAIEAWNTRKPMERIVERLEEMKMRYFLTIGNTGSANLDSVYEEVGDCIDKAIEIVKEEGGL
jgi:hypothetical protein